MAEGREAAAVRLFAAVERLQALERVLVGMEERHERAATLRTLDRGDVGGIHGPVLVVEHVVTGRKTTTALDSDSGEYVVWVERDDADPRLDLVTTYAPEAAKVITAYATDSHPWRWAPALWAGIDPLYGQVPEHAEG